MSVLSQVELVQRVPEPRATLPTTETVRAAIIAGGFPAERCFEITDYEAFSRAVTALKGKDERVTCWEDNRDVLHGQVEQKLLEEGQTRCRWVRTKSWTASVQNGQRVLTGDEPLPNFLHYKQTYTWGDVYRVIHLVLTRDGLGAYLPRGVRGMYFVPTGNLDVLDRLVACVHHFGLDLPRTQFPDTETWRVQIGDAISDALNADIDEHLAAIDAYTVESSQAGVVENRREGLVRTAGLITRVANHLNGHAQVLQARLTALDLHCNELIEQINTYRPAGGGRQVRLGGVR